MKKLTVLLGMSIILLVSGCSNGNKLTCTKKEKSAGYDSEQNVSFIVKKDQLKESDMNVEIDYSSMGDSEFKSAYEVMEKMYTGMESEGLTTTVEKENKIVKINVNIDFDKADKKIAEETLPFQKDKNGKITIDTIKKELEENGYTCK